MKLNSNGVYCYRLLIVKRRLGTAKMSMKYNLLSFLSSSKMKCSRNEPIGPIKAEKTWRKAAVKRVLLAPMSKKAVLHQVLGDSFCFDLTKAFNPMTDPCMVYMYMLT